MLRFFVFIFLFSSALSFAGEKSCAPVSLPLKSMGAVRNQGVSGLCFAYAAADLASWATGMRVSAIDLALYDFKLSKYPRFSDIYRNGGDTVLAVNTAAKEGFCLEERSPSDEAFFDFSVEPATPIYAAFNDLEVLSWDSNEAYTAARIIFPHITPSDFKDASRFRYSKRRILELQNANCPQRNVVPGFQMKSYFGGSASQYIAAINRELNQGQIVGIAFHSNAIYNLEEEADGHAVAVVGRRWNEKTNSCEYQLRDTFGDSCEDYRRDVECDGGYLWVKESTLRKNIFEVMYIPR